MTIPQQSNRVYASARDSEAVTPNDSTVLSFDALYIGAAGNVAIKHESDRAAVTFVAVPAGSILPVAGVRVMSTNTTASSIVALRW